MSETEFNAILGGIIALIVAIMSLIGVVYANTKSNSKIANKTDAIHHQTLNNGGDSMRDHIDSTKVTAESLNRKFDKAYREFSEGFNHFRDDTNRQFGKVNEKVDRLETTVISHHGGLL